MRGRTSRFGASRVATVMVVASSVLVGTIGGGLQWRARHVTVPLLSSTVGVSYRGGLQAVGPAAHPSWAGDTRVLLPAGLTATQQAAANRRGAGQLAWLAKGRIPGAGTPYACLARTSLLDLHVLTRPGGAQIAGAPGPWHYVWPRDASFGAVALARTGHLRDAEAVLAFLQRVQAPNGSFQARYLTDGSGPPDDRGLQEDGPGWALWATDQVARGAPGPQRTGLLERLRPLVRRSLNRLQHQVDQASGLPSPSEDYWEVPQDRLTLGIGATSLAGLRAGADLARMGGDTTRVTAATRRADSLQAALVRAFGTVGWPRTPGGAPDAAVTFLLPPFQPDALPGATAARDAAVHSLRRRAGGLAPGADWKQDGISWTPETALFALSDASTAGASSAEGADPRTRARQWLSWLAAHRTNQGSLPEKVLADGRPAGPAPLAWTAALVVLTIEALSPRRAR